ncbi:MAG: pyruvate, phosphate dikinase [Myxococcales bacterium]|nr:MAG: pyruvate, phosphate dikinase [Myxococcales bacterium]
MGTSESKPGDPSLLGGKGAGLSEMASLGLPVPPGFTLSTALCTEYYANDKRYPESLREQVGKALSAVEKVVKRRFGDPGNPMLVSVRSGARVSMPGMMDTVLNVGLNDETVEGLGRKHGDMRFALDAYRRLLMMYGDVVLGAERRAFENELVNVKTKFGDARMPDPKVPEEALRELIVSFKSIIREQCGVPFPQDPQQQLWGAISAVFDSWMNPRAKSYRRMYNFPEHWGTAVNVQTMVFGNLGNDSGSGVVFSRNPSNGDKHIFGEYLQNAQGEDVVAGTRTPSTIRTRDGSGESNKSSMEMLAPQGFSELLTLIEKLEKHRRDMQDIEFTLEQGKLWILQTRSGKRTGEAAVRIATDLVAEGLISKDEAVLRVEPAALDQLMHPVLPGPKELSKKGIEAMAKGLPASPGAACGQIVLTPEEAESRAAKGMSVVLVRNETSPDDIRGMKAAVGILTATGGMTSHAAVVARGMGKPCVVGANAVSIDEEKQIVRFNLADGSRKELQAGDIISLDGSRGYIYGQGIEVAPLSGSNERLDLLLSWADEYRRMVVRANADAPADAALARRFGAKGIGLCRTEHMFFEEERLLAVRCVLLADSPSKRGDWLAKLKEVQRKDFYGLFTEMEGLPVTVRLLDWPMHEFMPRLEKDISAVAKALGEPLSVISRRSSSLRENNPMLGHRGVRLGLTHPEIYAMQTHAIMEAAADCHEQGHSLHPEIMIPLVCTAKEMSLAKELVKKSAHEVLDRRKISMEFSVGTMLETPRACLVADKIAEHAEFCSFGTNDLTQTVYGISRDDAGKFFPQYMGDELSVLTVDPFSSLDPKGVAELLKIAVEKARRTRSGIKMGICGEHGGDPESIEICERVGLDYVSCSPFRVPIARLAAAQATLKEKESASNSTMAL